MKITLTPRTLTIAFATIATIATTIGVASLVAGGDSVADHINGGAIVPASDEISGGAFVVRASAGQIDTFRRTSTNYSAEGGVWARVPAAEGTPTPTPWLAVRVENPQGTPAPVDDLYYHDVFPYSTPVCSDCSQATLAHTHTVGAYSGVWFSDTEQLNNWRVWVTAVPTGGAGFYRYGTLNGWNWESWNTGGAAANIVVATQTPTPSPTPTPAPQMVAEAINPEGTRVPTWRLGQLGGEYCEHCSQYTEDMLVGYDPESIDFPGGGTPKLIYDIDEDGDNDIISPPNIWWNDSGVFSYTSEFMVGGSNMAVGDIDGDSDADIAAVETGAGFFWLENDDDGESFTQHLIGYPTRGLDVALEDVDDDSDLDIVLLQGEIDGVASQVWVNDGSGVFSYTNSHTAGELMEMADLNGDDDPDIFIARDGSEEHPSHPDNANLVLFGETGDSFTDTDQELGLMASVGLSLGDVDGDGDVDAVTSDQAGTSGVTVWFNDGTGYFTSSDFYFVHPEMGGIELVDIENDGDLDLVIATGAAGVYGSANLIWINDGDGEFEEGYVLEDFPADLVATGDLNGNSYPDLIFGKGEPAWEDRMYFRRVGVYIEPYANQQVIGVTPQPEICGMSACGEASDDDTEYHWYEDRGSSVRRAQFVVVTPTPTPTPDPSTGDARLRVETDIAVFGITIRSVEIGGCAACFSCSSLEAELSECISATEDIQAIIYTSGDAEIVSLAASPNTGEMGEDRYSYAPWSEGQRTLQFQISEPGYGQYHSGISQTVRNPDMGEGAEEGNWEFHVDPDGDDGWWFCGSHLPDEAVLPDPPAFQSISLTNPPHLTALNPATFTLEGAESDYELPTFTLTKRVNIGFNRIFSQVMKLDVLIENAVLGNVETQTTTFDFDLQMATGGSPTSTRDITTTFGGGGITETEFIEMASTNLETARNIEAAPSLPTFKELASVPPPLGGKTTGQIATELASSFELPFAYARALAALDGVIIGPAVVGILWGVAWIIYITFLRLLAKASSTVIDIIIRIINLIADIFI